MNDYSSNTRKFLARRLLRFESLEQRRVLSSHPIATPNAYTASEDVTLTGNLIGDDTGNGSDQPGNPGGTLVAVAIDGQTLLREGAVSLPSGATIEANADGQFVYDASSSESFNRLADGESASDSFDYVVAHGFSEFYVFGDSLSDTGNLFQATGGTFPPDPPYHQGRSSNGSLWVEYLSPRLNVGSSHVQNFAVFGAETGRGNINEDRLSTDLPGLLDEIDQFTVSLAGGPADAAALYVVWAGANDFFSPPSDPAAAIAESIGNLVTAVSTLKTVGAQHILVPNMADLGVTPFAISLGASQQFTEFSAAFNGALSSTLSSLGLDVIEFDSFAFFNNLAANADALGFTVISQPCFDGVSICETPDTYGFWDSVHPTTRVHELLADAVFSELLGHAPLNETASAVVTVNVTGVTTIPSVHITGPAIAVPGQSVTIQLAAADSSPADAAGMFEYAVDWRGDGRDVETVRGPASGLSVSHVFQETGNPSVAVTATDHDGDQSPAMHHQVNVQTAAVIDGDLFVGGTTQDDRIRFLQHSGGQVSVFVNHRAYGPFPLAAGARLVAFGLDGNDQIIAANVRLAAEFDGGAGHDHLTGTRLDDILTGGIGNDWVFGGAGSDVLRGGAGNDWLFGGKGDDNLDGGDGFDWLFGGPGSDALNHGERVFA